MISRQTSTGRAIADLQALRRRGRNYLVTSYVFVFLAGFIFGLLIAEIVYHSETEQIQIPQGENYYEQSERYENKKLELRWV